MRDRLGRYEKIIGFALTPIAQEFDEDGEVRSQRELPPPEPLMLYYPWDAGPIVLRLERELNQRKGDDAE